MQRVPLKVFPRQGVAEQSGEWTQADHPQKRNKTFKFNKVLKLAYISIHSDIYSLIKEHRS